MKQDNEEILKDDLEAEMIGASTRMIIQERLEQGNEDYRRGFYDASFLFIGMFKSLLKGGDANDEED